MATRKKKTGRKRTSKSEYSRKASTMIGEHIRKHKRERMPQRQAVAAAMSEARRSGRKVPSRRGRSARGTGNPTASRRAATKQSHASRVRAGKKAAATRKRRGR